MEEQKITKIVKVLFCFSAVGIITTGIQIVKFIGWLISIII